MGRGRPHRFTARIHRITIMLVAALGGVVAPAALNLGSNAGAATAGWFSVHCKYSHSLSDDPVVFPGVSGISHRHDFFAAKQTNADSTLESMLNNGTTCGHSADTSGYWAPALISPSGVVVKPLRMTAYYRAVPTGGTFAVPPTDLRLIAGYPTAVTGVEKRLGYSCLDSEPLNAKPIDCTGHAKPYEKAHIFFPNCWDGEHLDSADHRSHVVYPNGTKCPSDHPVKIPRLSFHITYPVTDGRGYYLSSDASKGVTDGASLHADFWNAWDPAVLTQLVAKCINGGTICGEVTG